MNKLFKTFFHKKNGKKETPKLVSGFTLLELLIYIAILSGLVVICANIFISISKGNGQSQVKSEINSSIRFVDELIKQDIKAASSVSLPVVGTPGSSLTLVRNGVTIVYDVSGGALRRKEGSATPVNLTNSNVIVGTPVFTRIENTNSIFNTTDVAVKSNIPFSYNSTSSDWNYSSSLESIVNLIADGSLTYVGPYTYVSYALSVSMNGTGNGTISSSPSGINCGSTCAYNYASGTSITLTATPTSGTFTSWSGCDSTNGATCIVSMSAVKSIVATFTATVPTYALSITNTGTGTGTVTSSPSGINCGVICSYNYTSGTSVTLTATPTVGAFTGWSGGGCSGTSTCNVTMSQAYSVTATFTAFSYTLSVTKAGTGSGTVTSSPSGISCGATCSYSYISGTSVTLTAVAITGSFTGWSGGGCSGTGTCVTTMPSLISVTATFSLPTYVLAVTKAGTGSGTVTSSPSGISCGATCSYSYTSGTSVTLTATPSSSTFTGWSGGGCSGTSTCTVTMSAAVSVTATFSSAPACGGTLYNGYCWYKQTTESQSCGTFCASHGGCQNSAQTCAMDKSTFTAVGISCSYSYDPGQSNSTPQYNTSNSCYPRTTSWGGCDTSKITTQSCTTPRNYWRMLCSCNN